MTNNIERMNPDWQDLYDVLSNTVRPAPVTSTG